MGLDDPFVPCSTWTSELVLYGHYQLCCSATSLQTSSRESADTTSNIGLESRVLFRREVVLRLLAILWKH